MGYRAADVILPVAYESTLHPINPITVYRGEGPIPTDLYNIPLKNIPDLFMLYHL